jgi:hypothetical protein
MAERYFTLPPVLDEERAVTIHYDAYALPHEWEVRFARRVWHLRMPRKQLAGMARLSSDGFFDLEAPLGAGLPKSMAPCGIMLARIASTRPWRR